jgi:hypothetical protein
VLKEFLFTVINVKKITDINTMRESYQNKWPDRLDRKLRNGIPLRYQYKREGRRFQEVQK